MHRSTITMTLLTCLTLPTLALAQSSGGSSSGTTDPNKASAAAKVKGSAVRERRPGTWVRSAITRHRELNAQRLAYQRSGGDPPVPTPFEPNGSSGQDSGSGSDSGGVGGLDLGNLGGLLGGLNLDDLTGLLGGGGGSSGTGTNVPANLPQEAIDLIESAGININDLFGKSNNATTQTRSDDKAFGFAQTSDDEEPKFIVRWGDAMLSTLFTVVSVGIQTPVVVNFIADAIGPLIFPELAAQEAEAAQDSADTGNGTDDGSDDSTDGGADDTTDDGGTSRLRFLPFGER